MKAEVAAGITNFDAIGKEQFQRLADRGEGQVVPWDLAFGKQLDLEAFDAGGKIERAQARKVEQVDLVDLGHVEQAEQVADLDVGAGFLLRFAHGGLRCRLVVFHKAGWQGPVAVARFDRALA